MTDDPKVMDAQFWTDWLADASAVRSSGGRVRHSAFPHPVPLAELVRVAGTRWKIEEGFTGSKELAALDQHQVPGWTSWHRWTLLAMLAHAFPSVLTATQPTDPDTHPGADPAEDRSGRLIPLTRNEIRRLLTGLLTRPVPAMLQLHRSRWRRRHQAIARACHYRRRTRTLEDHEVSLEYQRGFAPAR